MYPWEGMASQALGMGMAQAQRAYPYPSGNYLPITTAPASTCNTFYIGDENTPTEVVVEKLKAPDEFTQLSNHKFHELLDKFSETI